MSLSFGCGEEGTGLWVETSVGSVLLSVSSLGGVLWDSCAGGGTGTVSLVLKIM